MAPHWGWPVDPKKRPGAVFAPVLAQVVKRSLETSFTAHKSNWNKVSPP